MKNTFNKKDLVAFGNYLLSDERRELYKTHPEFQNEQGLEERLKVVNDADFEFFKEPACSLEN